MAAVPEAAPEIGQAVRRGPAGWRVVARKEFTDHVLSIRFTVLVVLLGLIAVASVYSAASGIRDAAPEASGTPALFLLTFTLDADVLFSFLGWVSLLAPLLGIAFGFDAVNGERSLGTLPRLVAQPIHRDDVINGKFAAGLTVIGVGLAALTLVVSGLVILRLGVVPSGEEVIRLVLWLAITILYVGFWLAFSTLCSVAFRGAATSVLVAMATWLVLALFAQLLLGIVADAIAPVPDDPTAEEVFRNLRVEQQVGRLSPSILYEEATLALLDPGVRTLGVSIGFVIDTQTGRAPASILPLDQSLLVAWPQTVAIVALTLACFAAAYVLFMRQEIRA